MIGDFRDFARRLGLKAAYRLNCFIWVGETTGAGGSII
jgi:hypothetical protein